mgnify:FL=1
MKELVYPAILFKDDESGTNTGWYTIKIPDLGIITDGDSVESAYIKAKGDLCSLVDCAIKFDCEIESPTDFEKVYKEYGKKNIVLLVDALA